MSEAMDTCAPNLLWRTRYDRSKAGARDWKEITSEIAERHGLTWQEITGPSRKRRMVWPRQEAFAVIWAQGRLSLPAIGRRFNRDHTTVLHGARAHAKRLAEQAAAE